MLKLSCDLDQSIRLKFHANQDRASYRSFIISTV